MNDEARRTIHSAAHTDPATIEREIAQTRGRVDETLDALQAKLSPGQMLDKALRYLRENGSDIAENVGHQIKQNPIPFVLTGIGLAWLISTSRQGSSFNHDATGAIGRRVRGRLTATLDHAGESLGEMSDRGAGTAARIGEATSSAYEHAAGAARDTYEQAANAAHTAYDRAAGAAHSATRSIQVQTRRLKQNTSRLMEEQPLVVGLVGLAAGALLGALLPSTETEDQLMGPTRDRTLDTAKETVKNAAEQARDAVANVTAAKPDEGAARTH